MKSLFDVSGFVGSRNPFNTVKLLWDMRLMDFTILVVIKIMFGGDNPIFHSVLNTVGQEIGKTSF